MLVMGCKQTWTWECMRWSEYSQKPQLSSLQQLPCSLLTPTKLGGGGVWSQLLACQRLRPFSCHSLAFGLLSLTCRYFDSKGFARMLCRMRASMQSAAACCGWDTTSARLCCRAYTSPGAAVRWACVGRVSR